MIRFSRETLSTIWDELAPLMQKHNKEIDLFGEELNLAIDSYNNLESFNNIGCFTVRQDETLIGYAVFLIYPHLHHKTVTVAAQDAIYIDPTFRITGIEFIRYTEKELKQLGVDIVMQSAPTISRLGGVLERLGYDKLETIYTRKL